MDGSRGADTPLAFTFGRGTASGSRVQGDAPSQAALGGARSPQPVRRLRYSERGRGTAPHSPSSRHLVRERSDRADERRGVEDVVVPGAGHADEALRDRRRGEEGLAEGVGDDLVPVAVRDEERYGERAEAGERVEALPGEGGERSEVVAGDGAAWW